MEDGRYLTADVLSGPQSGYEVFIALRDGSWKVVFRKGLREQVTGVTEASAKSIANKIRKGSEYKITFDGGVL